jgi:hypothetical protein
MLTNSLSQEGRADSGFGLGRAGAASFRFKEQ